MDGHYFPLLSIGHDAIASAICVLSTNNTLLTNPRSKYALSDVGFALVEA